MALLGGALGALALAVVRPDLALMALDRIVLKGGDIRIHVDEARLERPEGRPWQWRIEGGALLSERTGTPSVHLREAVLDLPDLWTLVRDGELALSRAEIDHLIVYQPASQEPSPVEPETAWPLARVHVGRGLVRDFELVFRDIHEVVTVIEGATGQIRGFVFDWGRRAMYGRGEARGSWVRAGPLRVESLHARSLAFRGDRLRATGTGRVAGQPLGLEFIAANLFRAPASVQLEADGQDLDAGPLADALLGDDTPIAGVVTLSVRILTGDAAPNGYAIIEANSTLRDVTIGIGDEVGPGLRAGLALAPFVRLDGDAVRLYPMSGRVRAVGYDVTLHSGRYEAPGALGHVGGTVEEGVVDALVHFVPRQGVVGIEWGLAVEGPIRQPQTRVLLGKALREAVGD